MDQINQISQTGQLNNWLLYITAFACAFGLSLFSTPLAKKLSIKLGAVSYPNERSMHKEPMPQMGGLAIVIGVIITLAVLMPFVPELRTAQFYGFLAGALVIIILGMLDDIYSLRPSAKLAFQIVAALIAIFTGTEINTVTWPFTTYFETLAVPITLIWIVGVTNAVNLIDGLDGLAAGVCAIYAVCLIALCSFTGNYLAVIFCATLAGSCIGFLPRNFSPAEVFMGDTGALFLGYAFAVTSIMGVFKTYALLSIIIACFALALPIFDTAFAIVRRTISGRSFSAADRGHLHHRLINMGFSHAKAVAILYVLAAVTGVMSIFIALRDIRALLVIAAVAFILLISFYAYGRRVLNEGRSSDKRPDITAGPDGARESTEKQQP